MAYLIEKMSKKPRDTHALLFYFQAAFDTVDHGLLPEKMERIFEWDGPIMDNLLAALCDRFGKVVIDGESSDVRLRDWSGIGQGWPPAPILFTLYGVDFRALNEAIKHVEIIDFADERQLNSQRSIGVR